MRSNWGKSWHETMGKTVSGISEGATRIKLWNESKAHNSPSFSKSSKLEESFVKLPIESAKKLQWYDQVKLKELTQSNLEEKELLFDTINALKQILLEAGISEDDVESKLKNKISNADKLSKAENALSSFLLISATAKIEELKDEINSFKVNMWGKNPHEDRPIILRINVQDFPDQSKIHTLPENDSINGQLVATQDCIKIKNCTEIGPESESVNKNFYEKQIKELKFSLLQSKQQISELEHCKDELHKRDNNFNPINFEESKLNKELFEARKETEELKGIVSDIRADARRREVDASSKISSLEESLGGSQFEVERLLSKLGTMEEIKKQNEELKGLLKEYEGNGQIERYKEIVDEQNCMRIKLEEEILRTARIVQILESKLRFTEKAQLNSETRAVSALQRAIKAESEVEEEVARRQKLMHDDHCLWPPDAIRIIEESKEKLLTLERMSKNLQDGLAQANAIIDEKSRHLKRLQAELQDTLEKHHSIQQENKELARTLNDWARDKKVIESKKTGFKMSEEEESNCTDVQNISESVNSFIESPATDIFAKTDTVYFKNVLFRFIMAVLSKDYEKCSVLLPAVATLLHANKDEFKDLKSSLAELTSWWRI